MQGRTEHMKPSDETKRKAAATEAANQAAHRAHFAKKDAEYARRLRDNDWPSDTCDACKRKQGCCESFTHHNGDCCNHCGNDERNPRKWLFRGK